MKDSFPSGSARRGNGWTKSVALLFLYPWRTTEGGSIAVAGEDWEHFPRLVSAAWGVLELLELVSFGLGHKSSTLVSCMPGEAGDIFGDI